MNSINKKLKFYANIEKVKILQRFFKTGKGEYGENDLFLGIVMPVQRQIAKEFYKEISLNEVEELLHGKYHEERMTALIILTYKFFEASEKEKTDIYEFYLNNTKFINNWDLVDVTTPNIVGEYLLDKDKAIIYKLSKSNNLWERRISILATFTFIRNNKFDDTLKISKVLLKDKEDLIHKAVGWMLREVGKRNFGVENKFLIDNYKEMPRTMLRYSIEKFPEELRLKYLKGDI